MRDKYWSLAVTNDQGTAVLFFENRDDAEQAKYDLTSLLDLETGNIEGPHT